MPSPLPVPVEVDAETGIWSVDGQPMVLVPRHFWAFVQMESERRFGAEATREIYHDAAFRAARVWCEREAGTHGLSGIEVFRHYLARMSARGWGRMTIETIDARAGTAGIRLDHSALAAEYGAKAGRRVCYWFGSAYAGAMEFVA
ncbi:MAG TPA: DUF5943 domain-containing protein, partial [Stellaceae bacterium]|nr:DUF5943 domain-containing protein [Stellaceae bacterium]